jgi:hypothetical protein
VDSYKYKNKGAKKMTEDIGTKKDRIEVMMPLEAIGGKYANYLRIGHTPTEFILDFCLIEGSPNAHSLSRVIISPIQIKSFLAAIQENVRRYEESFHIVLPDNIDAFFERGVIKKG